MTHLLAGAVAEQLGVKPQEVIDLIDAGVLRASRPNGGTFPPLVSKADLGTFIEAGYDR